MTDIEIATEKVYNETSSWATKYDSELLNGYYKFKDRKQSKKKVSFNDDDMSEY